MWKSVAVLALVATAQAQWDGTVDASGPSSAERRQELDLFELSTLMESRDNEIATLQAVVDTLAAGDSAIAIGVTATANDMTQRATGILTDHTILSTQIETLAGNIQTVNDGVELQLVAANAEAVSRAAAAEAAALSAGVALSAHVSTAIVGITRSVAGDVSGLTASLANSTAATTRTVAGVTTALAGKADNIKKLWSGGCSQYPGGGWNWYCLDRELYNTAAGYFVKADNTRFRALRANMMINFVVWTITHGSGWNIVNMYLDGTQLMYSYSHTAGCWWRDMQGNMLFKVNVGQHWRVRMHGACSHSFHPGGRIGDYHSRLSIFYEGQSE